MPREVDLTRAIREPRIPVSGLERLAAWLGVVPKKKSKKKDQWRADVMLACLTVFEREAHEAAAAALAAAALGVVRDDAHPTLREGSHGADVLRFQKLLRVAPTGRLSFMDALEVGSIQEAFGLPVTRVVDKPTWLALEGLGWNPNIKPGPWFRCKKCDKPLPDRRDRCSRSC